MGELYHGSNIKGLKVLHTHQSTHGKYVYATPHKGLALLFSGIAGDDLTYTIFRNGKKEPWNIVERVPIAFKTMFSIMLRYIQSVMKSLKIFIQEFVNLLVKKT